MNTRYQARFRTTGEPIGIPQDTAAKAAQVARRDGFRPLDVVVEKLVKVDGTWRVVR